MREIGAGTRSIKSLQGRIHPGTAAQTAVAGLRGHLNSADASGRATLQAENVTGACGAERRVLGCWCFVAGRGF